MWGTRARWGLDVEDRAGAGANRLIGPVLDRVADCPEYKVTPVRVRPE